MLRVLCLQQYLPVHESRTDPFAAWSQHVQRVPSVEQVTCRLARQVHPPLVRQVDCAQQYTLSYRSGPQPTPLSELWMEQLHQSPKFEHQGPGLAEVPPDPPLPAVPPLDPPELHGDGRSCSLRCR